MLDFFKKGQSDELKKYPSLKQILVKVEKEALDHPNHEYQAPSDRLLMILSKLQRMSPATDLKICKIKDMDDFSPLFGRQIRTSILLDLIKAGFSQDELEEKYEIRHGVTLGDNYYFLNLKSQNPFPSNIKAIDNGQVALVDDAETVKIQFVSVVVLGNDEIGKQEVGVAFELIMGRAHLQK